MRDFCGLTLTPKEAKQLNRVIARLDRHVPITSKRERRQERKQERKQHPWQRGLNLSRQPLTATW